MSATLTTSYLSADRSEPVLETTVGDALRRTAAEHPERTALIEGSPDPGSRQHWTYGELVSDAERVARALLARFSPGEHVAVWAPNSAAWVLLEYGAALAGLTLVTVNPALKESEVEYALGQSRAAGVFYLPEYRGTSLASIIESVRPRLPGLREAISLLNWDTFLESARPDQPLPQVSPDDIVQIQYTSGTTGFPKGALLHHRGLTNNARLFARRLGAGPGDVWLNAMPLFHTAGCVMNTLGSLQTGGANLIVPGFEPGLVLELIESEAATYGTLVPTMLLALLAHPAFPSTRRETLRALVTGGAPVNSELVRRVEGAFGIPLTSVYAQTEASPVITQTRTEDTPAERETCGRPLPQTEVKIVEPGKTEPVAVGTVGEICARGYQVMRGYFNMPEQSAAAIDREGWLHTGDLGRLDAHGVLHFAGRLKDMIIRGDRKSVV